MYSRYHSICLPENTFLTEIESPTPVNAHYSSKTDADLFITLVRTLQMTVATSLIFIGGEPHSFRCHPSHVSP